MSSFVALWIAVSAIVTFLQLRQANAVRVEVVKLIYGVPSRISEQD